GAVPAAVVRRVIGQGGEIDLLDHATAGEIGTARVDTRVHDRDRRRLKAGTVGDSELRPELRDARGVRPALLARVETRDLNGLVDTDREDALSACELQDLLARQLGRDTVHRDEAPLDALALVVVVPVGVDLALDVLADCVAPPAVLTLDDDPEQVVRMSRRLLGKARREDSVGLGDRRSSERERAERGECEQLPTRDAWSHLPRQSRTSAAVNSQSEPFLPRLCAGRIT